MYSKYSIAQTAATVSALMGTDAPECAAEKNELIYNKAIAALPEGEKFDRVLLYNPDAIALWIYQKYTDILVPVVMRTDMQIPLTSVMPSVTPVCFASMYTGAMPEVHGIQRYEKPVLTTDTLLDAAIRAGKRCAIVSETDASISKIFLERDMDYYIIDEIDDVNAKAAELIKEDKYDLIVVYNGNYDEFMHRWSPEGEQSLEQLEKNSADFSMLIDLALKEWKNHNVFYGYCPDHGCHEIDGGCGSHGLDMDEDMNVIHAYGWRARD